MEKNDAEVLSVRVPIELYNKLKKQAEKDVRSMSQQVVFYIKESLPEFKSPPEESKSPPKEYKPPPDQEGDAEKQAEGQ